MDPITQGREIFKLEAQKVSWKETKSITEAKAFLKSLYSATNGNVIVDFLDSASWDRFEGIEINEEKNYLYMHWHDYRDKKEAEDEKRLRQLGFPANLYSLFLHFKELRIVETRNFPAIFIRGHALKDKEIKSELTKDVDDFEIFDDKNNFSKLLIRKKGSSLESFDCFNTPIFSIVIIPKNSGVSAYGSKKALFSYNLADASNRLKKVFNFFETDKTIDEDTFCEKANTVRRIFEYVLKVECCYRYRQINIKKDYSELMLGDLIKLVKDNKEEAILGVLNKIVVWSNELSHESGKPIKKEKAHILASLALMYTEYLKSEINLRPNPDSEI